MNKELLLDDLLKENIITLDRGRVISSIEIDRFPGIFPVYSSSSQRNGLFGCYDKFDFDEELITWSVDGGGYFFYRPKHKFSVTNVSGILRIIRPELFDYKFLYYSLAFQHASQYYDYSDKAHPSVIRKQYFIPCIDLFEQQKIASILSKLDEAIEQTELLIEKYKRIKTGLMHDLLTRGIDENGNIRAEQTHPFKDSPLGRIPVEWECITIGNMIERLRSGVTPKGGSEVYQKEGIMLIRSQNVYPYGFELDDVAYISDIINNEMSGSELKELDVLLNITGASIGRSTFVPEKFPKANVNQHVCSIRLKEPSQAKSIFVSSFLNSPLGQNQIIQHNAGSNRQGLNYSQIKQIHIPCYHNEHELEHFKNAITKIEKTINQYADELEKLKLQKSGLMHDLLTGKIRVMNMNKTTSSIKMTDKRG